MPSILQGEKKDYQEQVPPVFDIHLFNKVCPSVNKQDLQEKQIMYIWSASRWPKLVFFFNETHKKFKSIHL